MAGVFKSPTSWKTKQNKKVKWFILEVFIKGKRRSIQLKDKMIESYTGKGKAYERHLGNTWEN